MMKKNIFALITILSVALLVAPQVSAMEVRITQEGYIEFYNDDVLGETAGEDGSAGLERKAEPVRITPVKDKEIQIRGNYDKTQVRLKTKTQDVDSTNTTKSAPSESVEASRFRMEFPAKLKDTTMEKREMRETAVEKATTPEAQRNARLEKTKEDRRERSDETLELESQFKNDRQVFELQSRHVRAQVQSGAEFTLDPETNQVTIVTPSGNEHVLTHLPDQAIERMRAQGLLTGADNQVDKEVEVAVETTEDGKVLYKTNDVITKRLFGVFKRKMRSEIVLDDETGEVTEKPIKQTSLFGKFLDSASY